MTEHGIIHQFLCAYISQQNNVVECNNRHLLQTTCTLLIHRKASKYFWSDAILTTCYLINQIPFILQNQIPYFGIMSPK